MKIINSIKKYIKLFLKFLQNDESSHVHKFKIFCFLMIFLMTFFFVLEMKRYLTFAKELFDEGVVLFYPKEIYYNITDKNKLFTKPKTNYSVLLMSSDNRFNFKYDAGKNYSEAYLIFNAKTNIERKVFADIKNKKYFVTDKNYSEKEYSKFQKKSILKRSLSALSFAILCILFLTLWFIKYLRDLKLGVIKTQIKKSKVLKKRKK